MNDLVFRYFPEISESQGAMFSKLRPLYSEWNSRINVISRRAGGGFPGIPLAIMFPDAEFTLIDSIGKKIMVVTEISAALGLKNVIPVCSRVEDYRGSFDFIVSRAVTELSSFVRLTSGKIRQGGSGSLPGGIFYLKGGDLSHELAPFAGRYREWNINEFFGEPFFETKKVIYLPL